MWHTPIIPAVRRVRQEDCCKFEASLDYVLLGKPGLQSDTLSEKKPKDDDLKKMGSGSLKTPQNFKISVDWDQSFCIFSNSESKSWSPLSCLCQQHELGAGLRLDWTRRTLPHRAVVRCVWGCPVSSQLWGWPAVDSNKH